MAAEPDTTRDLYTRLDQKGFRTVNVDTLIPGFACNFVGTDNEGVMRLAIDHLMAQGHRRITFLVNEPDKHGNCVERLRAFERLAGRRGLEEARVVSCGTKFWESSYDAAYRTMDRVMQGDVTPTAIIAMSDPGGWAAMKWLAEHGVQVPGDVSVMGCSNERPSRFTYPAMTAIAPPIRELARRAIALLQAEHTASDQVLLAPELDLRASTGSRREAATVGPG